MRMNSCLAFCASIVVVGAVNAGPLAPPPGAVQATGRTQINKQYIASLPYTISQAGSYVLTSNLTGTSGADGIVIAADDVTIDLAGFSLIGVSGSINGIAVNNPGPNPYLHNLTIINGAVKNWDSAGVSLSGATNVEVRDIRAYQCSIGIQTDFNARIVDCTAESHGSLGIFVGNVSTVTGCSVLFCGGGISTGSTCSISNCVAESNFGPGIRMLDGCTVLNCTSRNNFTKGNAPGFQCGDKCHFTNCSASNNGSNGFDVVNACSATGCTSVQNNGAGFYTFDDFSATNCNADDNGFIGIYFNGGNIVNCNASRNGSIGIATFLDHANIVNCNAEHNSSVGIRLDAPGTIIHCTASENFLFGIEASSGSDGSLITACNANKNLGAGITAVANCRIEGNSSTANQGDGIIAADRCTVTQNSCIDNGTNAGGPSSSGIVCNGGGARVDGNHVSGNDTGISATPAFRNVITRNTAFGNSPNYNLDPANDIGPIGTAATSTSPWANISF